MILNSTLITSIKVDTIPEDDDSNIRVPAILLPVFEPSLPLESLFLSTKAGPFSATQIMNVSSVFAFAFFQTNIAQSFGLIGAIGPGQWELDLQQAGYTDAPAALTAYITNVTFGYSSNGSTETIALGTSFMGQTANQSLCSRKVKISVNRAAAYLGVSLPSVGVGITTYCYGSLIARRLS
jgi:hypothetical protein